MKFYVMCRAKARRGFARLMEKISPAFRGGLRALSRGFRNGAGLVKRFFAALAGTRWTLPIANKPSKGTLRRLFCRIKAEIRQAVPGFRAAWDKFGYYISLALLLALLGTAAHAYRGNGSAPAAPQATVAPEPAVVISGPVETPAPEATEAPVFSRPLEGEIAKGYCVDRMEWSDTLQQWQIHPGVDILSPQGCVVYAAADGVVKSAYKDALMGNVIVLRHEGGYETAYMGLKTLSLVEPGQEVERGQAISSVGDTAVAEQELGSHLHYEIRLDGEAIEPDWASEESAF